MIDDALLKVLDRLYDASTDVSKWPAFLKELAHAFAAPMSQIFHARNSDWEFSFDVFHGLNLTQDILKKYEDGVRTDVRVLAYERQNCDGRAASCRNLLSEDELNASAFFCDVIRASGVEYTLWASMPVDGADVGDSGTVVVGILRGPDGQPFTRHDEERFGLLIPHIRRALTLHRRLALLDLRRREAVETLSVLPVALIACDENGTIRFVNQQGQARCTEGSGLAIGDGHLRAKLSEDQSWLAEAIGDTVRHAKSAQTQPGIGRTIGRDGDQLSVLVSALGANHQHYGSGHLDQPLALVFVGGGRPLVAAETIQAMFGLSLGESRLVDHLVMGSTVEEAAIQLAITTGTARQRLKMIFQKTNTGRQSELVRLILSSPAVGAAVEN